MLYPRIVDKFKRAYSHNRVECTPEVGDAQMAHVSKNFYRKLLHIIVMYVVKRRMYRQHACVGKRLLRRSFMFTQSCDFYKDGSHKPCDTCQISRLSLGHLVYDSHNVAVKTRRRVFVSYIIAERWK